MYSAINNFLSQLTPEQEKGKRARSDTPKTAVASDRDIGTLVSPTKQIRVDAKDDAKEDIIKDIILGEKKVVKPLSWDDIDDTKEIIKPKVATLSKSEPSIKFGQATGFGKYSTINLTTRAVLVFWTKYKIQKKSSIIGISSFSSRPAVSFGSKSKFGSVNIMSKISPTQPIESVSTTKSDILKEPTSNINEEPSKESISKDALKGSFANVNNGEKCTFDNLLKEDNTQLDTVESVVAIERNDCISIFDLFVIIK